MSPAYYSYYAALIGVDVYGGTDYTQIISHLPPNSKGAEVVKAALTRLGCPYVWGAKGSTKFDCSGLAYHEDHSSNRQRTATGQARHDQDHPVVGRLYPEYGETLRRSAEDTEKIKDLLTGQGFTRTVLKTLNFNVDMIINHCLFRNRFPKKKSAFRKTVIRSSIRCSKRSCNETYKE